MNENKEIEVLNIEMEKEVSHEITAFYLMPRR